MYDTTKNFNTDVTQNDRFRKKNSAPFESKWWLFLVFMEFFVWFLSIKLWNVCDLPDALAGCLELHQWKDDDEN